MKSHSKSLPNMHISSSLLLLTISVFLSDTVADVYYGCRSNGMNCLADEVCIDIPNGPVRCIRGRKLGEFCSPLNRDFADPCLPPLDCIKQRCQCAPRNRQCRGRIAKKGQSCSGTDVVCNRSLICHLGRCTTPNVSEGKPCNADTFNVCKSGLSCIGPTRLERCVKLAQLGEPCSSPYWNCIQGLQCIANECRSFKLPKGSACRRSEECAEALICGTDATGDAGICGDKRPEGSMCDFSIGFRTNFGSCAEGLSCEADSTRRYPTGRSCVRRG